MLSLRIWKISVSELLDPTYYLRRYGNGDDRPDEQFIHLDKLKSRFEKLLEANGSSDVVVICSPPSGTPDMEWHPSRETLSAPERPSSLDDAERNELWNALNHFAAKENAHEPHPA